MAIFGDFLRPLFPASRVQQVSDLHLKFALRPHACVEIWQTSNLQRLILGDEKRRRKKNKKLQHENIYGLPYSTGRP